MGRDGSSGASSGCCSSALSNRNQDTAFGKIRAVKQLLRWQSAGPDG
jgi:hypothetical protein